MTTIEGGGVVLLRDEARLIADLPVPRRLYATSDITGGAFSLIETIEPAAGGGPPLHIHHDAAESFYVIEGAYTMRLGGREFHCPAGSFIYIPRGMPHTFRSEAAGSRKLNLYTPSAMEGYFDELSDAVRAGVDDVGLAEIAARYSMEIVGPVGDEYLSRSPHSTSD